MESNDLEKFIQQNRDDFDIYEPSSGLWEKIEIKVVDTENKKENSFFSVKLLSFQKIAAVAVIFIVSYFVHDFFHKNNKENFNSQIAVIDSVTTDSVPEIIRDFEETQNYYVLEVSNKMIQLEKYIKLYPDLVEELKNEITSLDQEFESLNGDLDENVNRKEIVEAMIQNYRIKLEILENTISIINENEIEQKSQNVQDAL